MTIQRTAGQAFVVMSLFPWVSFGTNQRDTQPWALGLACVYWLLALHTPIPSRLLLLLLLVPAALAVGLFTAPAFDFDLWRGLFNYASVPVLLVALYVYVRNYGLPIRLVKAANVVYLAVAVAQQVLGVGVIAGWAPLRTTADRGVPSLAAEPTYFGVLLLFLTWIQLVAADYRPSRSTAALAVTNLLFVVFVAKSSMAILFLAAAAVLVVLYRFRPGLYGALAAAALAIVAGSGPLLQGTRVGALVDEVSSRGLLGVVAADASINVRLAHVVIPWYEAVVGLFVPHGFSAFAAAVDAAPAWHGGFFWYNDVPASYIMSFAGSFVFELGLVGLVFLGYLFVLVLRDRRRRAYELLFLGLLLNSAIPVACPIVPLVVVVLFCAEGGLASTDEPQEPSLGE